MPRLPNRIPSLDGLRALSILLVLAAHGFQFTQPHSTLSWVLLALAKNGAIGVSIFFVISGFLITTLLMREERRDGSIGLRGFYFRRAFRILPAFLLYVLAIAVLSFAQHVSVPAGDFASALTFTMDYDGHASWFLLHLWSLSVEEQFYLLWPLLVVFCSRRTLKCLAGTVIVLEPLIRLLTRKAFPATWGQIAFMGHTRADVLMFGCLAALFYDDERAQALVRRTFSWTLPFFCLAFLTVASPLLQRWSFDYYLPVFGYTAESVAITLLLWFCIQQTTHPLVRLLNRPFLVRLGVVSYSLYLWQQLFFAPPYRGVPHMLLAACAAWLTAECSYRLVEEPLLRVRLKLERRRPKHLAGAGPTVPS